MATSASEEPHCEAINIDGDQHQETINDNHTSNDESQQEDAIEFENVEPATHEITATTSQGAESLGKDYSIFGPWQKKFIVFTATMGAFFSPFSTQIYFPALTSIAKDLNVSNSKINLTVTTYMVCNTLLLSPLPR
jgi:hypothetical protein